MWSIRFFKAKFLESANQNHKLSSAGVTLGLRTWCFFVTSQKCLNFHTSLSQTQVFNAPSTWMKRSSNWTCQNWKSTKITFSNIIRHFWILRYEKGHLSKHENQLQGESKPLVSGVFESEHFIMLNLENFIQMQFLLFFSNPLLEKMMTFK